MIKPEQTVVMLKPQVISRGLVGKVITKFEMAGIHLDQLKVAKANRNKLEKFYVKDPNWMIGVGQRIIDEFKQSGLNVEDYLHTSSALTIGEMVYYWNIKAIEGGEIIGLLLSGPHAIERVKQIVGATEPIRADRGTIRGDWCTDSVIYSTSHKRGIFNLVHRSSNPQEVQREKKVLFN